MDFVFLPMKALMLTIILIGAVIGGFYFRKGNGFVGGVIGGTTAFAIIGVVMAVIPAKLTTNTRAYNTTQVQDAYSRHQEIPERVIVKIETFEDLQVKETVRSNKENKLLEESLK